MEKYKIVVPKDIRYIGDWKEYRLEDYPFPHILNKKLTGCGYTESCLESDQDVILVSPRKFLLQNKHDQHLGEVYYVNNCLERSIDYELDVSKDDTKRIVEEGSTGESTLSGLRELKIKVADYSVKCSKEGKPCKILVTYDSFRHVKEALGVAINHFQIVVDEFQSIFMDSRFKSSTELEFLTHLNGREKEGAIKLQKVCYVSATPMIDRYLEMLDDFKDLPYYELDWETEDPGRIRIPKIDLKFSHQTVNYEIKLIVQKYLNGKFEQLVNKDGNLVTSNEAVIFVNSVAGICQAIKTNLLLPEQCNIICADSTDNNKDLRNAFNYVYHKLDPDNPKPKKLPNTENMIGSIPLKGEPHKMFTFCTRTVYLGADFYSTCARTFIFSNANVECLSVDISMDLEQILGRQRLDENPWKNSAYLVVQTLRGENKMSKEEFDTILNGKISESKNLLKAYEDSDDIVKKSLANTYQKVAKTYHYKDDYVAVNRLIDKKGKTYYKPVFNNLMYVSELRAFEVQQYDYKDRFSVFSSIKGEGISSIDERIIQFAQKFNDLKDTVKKLKILVEFYEFQDRSNPEMIKRSDKVMNQFLDLIPSKYRDYYEIVTPERIKANSYKESEIKKEWRQKRFNDSITDEVVDHIYNVFEIGKRYTKADIKEKLSALYENLGYTKTAKATDLNAYFYIKPILTPDKKAGFEIIAKK